MLHLLYCYAVDNSSSYCSGGGEGVKRVLYEADVKPAMQSQLSAVVLGVCKHKKALSKIAEQSKLLQCAFCMLRLPPSALHLTYN